jgi:hypothetical protein
MELRTQVLDSEESRVYFGMALRSPQTSSGMTLPVLDRTLEIEYSGIVSLELETLEILLTNRKQSTFLFYLWGLI